MSNSPRNCASLDCVTIVAPGLSNKPIRLNNINLNGFGSKGDDDTASPSTTTTAPPAPAPGVPLSTPVAGSKVTPPGRPSVGLSLRLGAGNPVVLTAKLPAVVAERFGRYAVNGKPS